MRFKSYILIVLLAFVGVLSQHRNEAPNQEIVLQFHNASINSTEAQNTIEVIKSQLEELGVTNIRLKDLENGTLRISYHSEKAIADVKKTFTEDAKVAVDVTATTEKQKSPQSPSKEPSISYNLDIFEIQKQDTKHLDLNGVSVPVIKLKTEHYFDPNKFLSSYFGKPFQLNEDYQKTTKPAVYSAILKRHLSRKTPQVRAGPIC